MSNIDELKLTKTDTDKMNVEDEINKIKDTINYILELIKTRNF